MSSRDSWSVAIAALLEVSAGRPTLTIRWHYTTQGVDPQRWIQPRVRGPPTQRPQSSPQPHANPKAERRRKPLLPLSFASTDRDSSTSLRSCSSIQRGLSPTTYHSYPSSPAHTTPIHRAQPIPQLSIEPSPCQGYPLLSCNAVSLSIETTLASPILGNVQRLL